MSKSLRPSKDCEKCGEYFEAGYWFTGQYERLANGKRKLIHKGGWKGACPKCKTLNIFK
jgi:hypothetical protein